MDANGTTVIAGGTKFDGKIEVGSKLHIDGEFKGVINSSNVVTIGTTGLINGEVFAQKLVISGKLNGNADCESIDILAGGKVIGDLISKNLIIESKGQFEGTSKIKIDNQDNQLGSDKV